MTGHVCQHHQQLSVRQRQANHAGCFIRTECPVAVPIEPVEEAWLRVYADATPENELYLLGEALLDVADLFSQYRWRHFTSVQRILGLKVGTGGSAGVGWLKHVLDHRFFPELWSVRTRL